MSDASDGVDGRIAVGRVLILANPKARGFSRTRLAAIEAALVDAGVAVELRRSTARGDICDWARASGGAFDVVAVHGGDGSINEAIAGLRETQAPQPALALIPGGTANVLARETAASFSPAVIAAAIAAGRTRPLHYGLANGQPFVLMASAGFDAAVVHGVSPSLKAAIGAGAYLAAAFAYKRRACQPDVVVTAAGETIRCRIAICANAARYGGDFVIAPETSALRPGLRLVLVTDDSLFALLRIGLRLITGRSIVGASVRSLAVEDVEIAGPTAPVQIDGDAFGQTPVRVTRAPAPLRMICGRS